MANLDKGFWKRKNIYLYQYLNKKIWTPFLLPDKSPTLYQYVKVKEPLKKPFC